MLAWHKRRRNTMRSSSWLTFTLAAALVLGGCSVARHLPVVGVHFDPDARAGLNHISLRDSEGTLRRAQLWMISTYAEKVWVSNEYRKPDCDERDGSDCFQGDYECPGCLWSEDRSEMHRLGAVYDSAGVLMQQAHPRTSLHRLNWLAGQRVGLWVRQGELERAQVAADECMAEVWWCEALRAFVEHRSGEHLAAEARFGRVLRLMPPVEACYWHELGFYRDSMHHSFGHDAYGRLVDDLELPAEPPCPDEAEARRFWTLADPLWSMPGNDRLTEHYARLVDMAIHHQFMTSMRPTVTGLYPSDNEPWGAHLVQHHSRVMRHGQPVGWRWVQVRALPPQWPPPPPGPVPATTRRGAPEERPRGGRARVAQDPMLRWTAPPDVREPYGMLDLYGRGQGFIVALDVEDALVAGAEVFEPGDYHGMESYVSPHGPVVALPLQSGFFRRDGREVLLVRSRVPDAATVAADSDAPAWSLIGWNGDAFINGTVRIAGDTIISTLAVPWQPHVISLESVHEGGAWRGRTGTRPPDARNDVAISSVVITEPSATPPTSLDEALPLMLPTTRLAEGTRAAAYWELYATETVNAVVEVTVRRADRPGLLTRLLGGRAPELSVRWEELFEPAAGVATRTFDLDVERLAAGSYQLEMVLTLHTGDVLRSASLFSVQ
jgi:hypothetical protein